MKNTIKDLYQDIIEDVAQLTPLEAATVQGFIYGIKTPIKTEKEKTIKQKEYKE